MTGSDHPPEGAGNVLPKIEGITLFGELARGGMGVVYRGKQDFLNRKVAVKMISADQDGPLLAARFRREAQILADIKHPHIVACYAAGKTQAGQSYLVMELVDGPNLRDWVREHGALPVSVALRLARAVAEALGHAHELGVIHRDVKPQNILLESATSAGMDSRFPFVPKLVDLGLARMRSTGKPSSLVRPISDRIDLTVQGEAMGTPSTMSPEQHQDPDSVDFLSDIYGLGCVLYEMLVGHAAYRGSKLEVMQQKLAALGPDPCAENPTVPAEVGALVKRMLAFDRKGRPASYVELESELTRLLERSTASPVSNSAKPEGRRAPSEPTRSTEAGSVHVVTTGRVLAERFEIRERLGEGGMGEVFRAFDRHRREEVAVKVILPRLVEREDLRQRFLDEATLVSSLSHPNVVKCHDVHQDGSLFFLTMELLHGQTLRDRIVQLRGEGKTFGLDEAMRIGTALLEALDHVHRHRPNRRIIHRDVKPENVYLCDDGRILLMDFGIARHDAFDKRTVTGTAMGTAYYMAPEQLAGMSDIDQRADQFSAAVVIYELLTGRLPTGMAVPIRTLRPETPLHVAAAAERAMSQERGSRFPEVASFLRALQTDSSRGETGFRTRRTGILLKVSLLVVVVVAGLGLTFRGSLFLALEQWIVGVQQEREVQSKLAQLDIQFRALRELATAALVPLPPEFVQQYQDDLAAVEQATASGRFADALAIVDAAMTRCDRRGSEVRQAVQRKLPTLEQTLARLQAYASGLEGALRTKEDAAAAARLQAASTKADPTQRTAAEFTRLRVQFELAQAKERQSVWQKGSAEPMTRAIRFLGEARKDVIEGSSDLGALARGMRDAELAMESLQTIEQMVETTRTSALEHFLSDCVDLQRTHERIARRLAELEGVRTTAMQGLAPKTEELIAASLTAIEGGNHDAARRHLANAQWLQASERLDPWYEAAEATKALEQRNRFQRVEGETGEGPIEWLLIKQRSVEAALLRFSDDHDISGWLAAVSLVQELALLAEESSTLAERLRDANARQLLPVSDSESATVAIERTARAIWRRDATAARTELAGVRSTMERNVGLPELRERVLTFLASAGPLLAEVSSSPPSQTTSLELARTLEKLVRDGSGNAMQLETGQQQTRAALLQDFLAWEASQPAGKDARVLELLALAESLVSAPEEQVAIAASRRGIATRNALRDECTAARSAVDALAALDERRLLPGLQALQAEAAKLDTERAQPSCTRQRLGEIARELTARQLGSAKATVEEALEVAPTAPMEKKAGFRLLLPRLRELEPAARDSIDALIATLTYPAPNGFSVDENMGHSPDGHPLRIQHQKTGMFLRLVPSGSFQMGAADDERDSKSNERPRHLRVVQEAFYLGETEVTEAEWLRAGARTKAPGKPSDLPMDRMTLAMAQEFLRAAGDELRLPTETEWEYACRAGTETAYWYGRELTTDHAVFDTGKPETARSRQANSWGFHHMHGNLFEICEDMLRPYPLPNGPAPIPDASSSKRVIRGGSYGDTRSTCRSAFRREVNLENGMPGYGIRVARTAAR